MPTLPINKSSETGQEKGGGQPRLSLPGVRLSVQPAPRCRPGTPPHRHGAGVLWRKSLTNGNSPANGRSLVLGLSKTERASGQDQPGQDQDERIPGQGQEHGLCLWTPEPGETEGPSAPLSLSPVAFARQVLGVQLWDRQEEVLPP